MAAADEGDAGAEHASIDLRYPEDARSEQKLGKLHGRVESTAELAEISACTEHRACTAEDGHRYALLLKHADVPGSLVIHLPTDRVALVDPGHDQPTNSG